MGNCGRCGRMMFKPGEVICDFCKKTVSRTATRHAEKMNQRKEQEEEMLMNLAAPGKDDETKEDMSFEHYVDTHDASAVWAGDNKGKRRR